VLLKKINNYIICILISLFFLNAEIGLSKETNKEIVREILNEFSKKTEFSATFLQSNGQTIEEGLLGIKNNRLRIEYISPSKIIIILAEDKAMYYNKDLEELEYFNPQKTQAKIFFDIFFKENFFEDSAYSEKEKVLEIKKNITLKDDENIGVKIIFEKKPILIRKIEIIKDDEIITYSISDHNFFPSLDDKMFSMASPLIN